MSASISSPFASHPAHSAQRPIRLTPLSPRDKLRLWLRLEHDALQMAELAELHATTEQELADQLERWLAECNLLIQALSRKPPRG